MNELRLLFTRTGDALAYRLLTSWGGDAGEPKPFVPFLSKDDYEDLRWYLEDYMELPTGGAKVRAKRIEASLIAWGKELYAAVFDHGDHRELVNALIEGKPPKLLTIGTKDLDILRLPWELMADSRGPLTRRGVTLRRQLETAGRPVKYGTGKLPLRILLAVSRPEDAGFLDPRRTTAAMLDALGPLGEGVVVDFCRPATLERMEEMLRASEREEQRYHIVHFDGHGTFLPNSQIGALCFEKEEDAQGRVLTDLVSADRIGRVLSAHKIPLAILEACRSGQIGNVAAFRGVAPALLEAGVGSVLSMSHAVHVEATRILLTRFYKELVGARSIGAALELGRGALMAKPDRWLRRGPGAETVPLQDWFLPNLYQRGEDLVLVPKKAKLTKRAKAKQEVRRAPATGWDPGAFPGKPMYGFFGRAWELHQIERRFLKHRAVLLHGMGGMGKTSLAREAASWWTKPTGTFPDGACFVSFEQAGGAQRAIQVLGAYFEGADFEKRPEAEQRQRARELFQSKRVLVVWDNFESVLPAFQEGEEVAPYPEEERAETYRLFRSWTEDEKGLGRLLVTCRPGETGLGAVCKVELAGLARPDALSLLYKVMQTAEVKASYEQDALVDLLKAVEMHPLSIELVGAHLKNTGPEEIVADFRRLLDEFKGESDVERNQSLRASIAYSLRRLSKGAQETVTWLGMFKGGVFEEILLYISQMDPVTWGGVRGELEATALIQVEWGIRFAGKPYLRFHPTLALEVKGRAVETEVGERYVNAYNGVAGDVRQAFAGSRPRWAMEVMAREEANIRTAINWALDHGSPQAASDMGFTLLEHLKWSGRSRERIRWVTSLRIGLQKGEFSKAIADWKLTEAKLLLDQGKPREALEMIEAVVARLRNTSEFDAAFPLATACGTLGLAYHLAGWSRKAIPILKDNVQQWETLICQAKAIGGNSDVYSSNLMATLGYLANALRRSGELDDSLKAVERSISISRESGNNRGLATGLAQAAQILVEQGRHPDADARYDEALGLARRMGDHRSEAITLHQQGGLAVERRQYVHAAKLYRHALQIFQDMHDEGAVMHACNELGNLDRKAGRLAEARAWYERSREIATKRGDDRSMGIAAQNLGLVCRLEGDIARKQGDDARAMQCFTDAARLVDESLASAMKRQEEPVIAASCSQLGWIHFRLGNLDKAEQLAHRSREIRERLGLKEAYISYFTLANIARARGNVTEADAWQQKRDALVATLHSRAGAPALSQETIQEIARLALACAQASLEGASLGAAEEGALATLATWPAPINALPVFLRALGSGQVPALPAGLPRELAEVLGEVLDAVRRARPT